MFILVRDIENARAAGLATMAGRGTLVIALRSMMKAYYC
jgi:hypothetical protein